METQTLILAFFALCGAGILLSLATPASRQGSVLAWLGCLAATALILAGANALLAGDTFRQPFWSLPGLGTLTLKVDRLSAVFILVTGLVLFPASIFAAWRIEPGIGASQRLRVHRADAGIVCVHRFDFHRGRCGAVSAGLGSHVHSLLAARLVGARLGK